MSHPRINTAKDREAKVRTDAAGLIGRLFHYADLRRVLPGLVVSSLLSNVLALALPLAILQILDRVITNQAMSTLFYLTVGLLAALILEQVLRVINSNLASWLGAKFEHDTTMNAVEHLMRVPMRHYVQKEPSVYAEQLRAASEVARFYSGQSTLRLLDFPFVVIFLALIYLIGGVLVAVPITLLLIFSLLTLRYRHSSHQHIQRLNTNDERRSGFLFEVLAGIHSVKTMMMENSMLRRYEMLQRASAEQGEKLAYSNDRADRLGHYFSQIMVISVVFAGGWLVITGDMTPGGLAASIILSVRSIYPLRQGLTFQHAYLAFIDADQRLRDLMNLPVVDLPGKPPLPTMDQALELRGVAVRYNDKSILSGINLLIPKGTCIAIRGDSGSGKTILLHLLNGLEQPDAGEVLVDGRPLCDFSSDSLHHHIALLPAAGTIVTGTLLENLTMFDEALNDQALAAASELGLDAVVAGMKLGYETPLSESASATLPLGTRQLIAIVRALIRDPDIILFDEANIALDMESDRLLRQYLERGKGRQTLVLVTYRPSYLSMADRTYHLVNGELLEGEPTPVDAGAMNAMAIPETRPEAGLDVKTLVDERFNQPTDLCRCVLPLLNQLNWHGRRRELAEALPHTETPLDLSGFFTTLADLDYLPQYLGRRSREPDDRLLPCLYLPNGSSAKVVMERTREGQLRIFDGVTGEESLVNHLTINGDYYTFKETAPPAPEKANVSWVAGVLNRFQPHLRVIMIITLVTTLLNLVPALFVRSMWDIVIPLGDIRVGAYLLAGFLIAMAIGWVLNFSKSRLLAYVGGRVEYILGINLMQRILGLPSTAVEGMSVSRQVRRIRGLERLREYFVGPMALMRFDVPATLLLVIALAIINPWMVVVLLVSLAVFAAAGFVVLRMSRPVAGAASQSTGSLREFLDETLNVMRLIRQSGAEQTWLARLRSLSAKAAMNNFHERQFNQRVQGVALVGGRTTGLMGLVVSAWLAIHGEITGGTLIATLIIMWRITVPLQNLFLAASSIVQATENVRQVDNLMRLPKEKDRGTRQTIRPETPGGLELSRVSFRYANDLDPALLGLNFTIAPRQCVAVTGPDGAGKSTLLKLILRVYSPQAGNLRLDKVDIRQLNTTDLRSRISYMPQSCDVFYGTVAQNLRLVHPAATQEEIQWAAAMAGLLAEVEALPEGFHTRISNSRADELPRGFRQRLSLARTMLKPASVVLMDEPGSGMDQAGEAALIHCIHWLRGRATLILVSLRPGHLRLADQVVYLDKGRVSAMGPFDKIEEKVMAGLR